MNKNRRAQLVLVLSGLATALFGAVLALAAGEGIVLTPRFAPGERVRYRMNLTVETESTLPLAPQEASQGPLRLAFDLTWQVKALAPPAAGLPAEADGSVRLRAVIESLEIESRPADTWSLPTDYFVGKPITYRLLPDGAVDEVQAPEEWLEDGEPPAWLRTWLEHGSSSAGVPGHPVEPGQQWSAEREFEVPGLPRQRLTSESTYLRNEKLGEVPCARILTRFAVAGADSSEGEGLGGLRTKVERLVEGEGSRLSCYDVRNGRLLESSQTSSEHIRIEMQQQPQKAGTPPPPVVLESRTTTESHLRVVN